MKKASAERHAGRERLRMQAAAQALDAAVRQASAAVAPAAAIALALPETAVPAGRRVLHVEAATPRPGPPARRLSLSLSGPIRLALQGPNGCGKSTLLAMLAGELAPLGGRCEVGVPTAILDQRASALGDAGTLLQALDRLGARLPQGELRSRLALLGLGPAQVDAPAARLSGGERIKAALACARCGGGSRRNSCCWTNPPIIWTWRRCRRWRRRCPAIPARWRWPRTTRPSWRRCGHASARLGKREMDGRNGGAGMTQAGTAPA